MVGSSRKKLLFLNPTPVLANHLRHIRVVESLNGKTIRVVFKTSFWIAHWVLGNFLEIYTGTENIRIAFWLHSDTLGQNLHSIHIPDHKAIDGVHKLRFRLIRLIECVLRSLLKTRANTHHTDLLGINRIF